MGRVHQAWDFVHPIGYSGFILWTPDNGLGLWNHCLWVFAAMITFDLMVYCGSSGSQRWELPFSV
jgi:hypothetical protein